MRNIPAIKFPMVFWEANPKAAPPIAEADTIHSGCNPPIRVRAAIASNNMIIRTTRRRLLVVLGSSLTLLANRDKYVEKSRSTTKATDATISIERISCRSIADRKLVGGGEGVGVALKAKHRFHCQVSKRI